MKPSHSFETISTYMKNFFRKYFIITLACIMVLSGIYIMRRMWHVRDEKKYPADWIELQHKNDKPREALFNDLSGFYTNDAYGFSLRYPTNFEINELSTETGDMVILVQKKGEQEEFQILISSFEEEGPLIQERIKQDIPGIMIEQPLGIMISGIPALLFWSDDSVLGRTREVWFIHRRMLYQISSRAAFDETLSRIMATWRFAESQN